jgi:hypothetical protein
MLSETRIELVSDYPPDLPRLHTIATFLRVQLTAVEQLIATLEQQAAEQAARLPPAPPPDWELELDLSKHPAVVHAGGCTMGGKGWRMRAITRDTALHALGVDRIPACPYCSPDSVLGVLD